MQSVWLCPIAIFSCLLSVFRFSAIKNAQGGTALCVGFIAEELKPQGICLSCILGITVAV